MATCRFCGEPVDPEAPTTYQRVVGWGKVVSLRASGGVRGRSDIVLREWLDEWACWRCIHLQMDGLAPGQETLA